MFWDGSVANALPVNARVPARTPGIGHAYTNVYPYPNVVTDRQRADTVQVVISEHEKPVSIYRGVSFHRASGKFQAYLGRKYLGLYPDQMTAALVAIQARQRHRYRFVEDPELEELADFLGPIPVTRRWSWRQR